MAASKLNPRARDAGARARLARQLDGPKFSANRRTLQPQPSAGYVDELLVRLSDRLRLGHLEGWSLDFARSIIRQARRGGPSWRPSERQRAVAERILSERYDLPDMPLVEPDR